MPPNWIYVYFVLSSFIVQVSIGSGVFELKLSSFKNEDGLDLDDNCCSGIHTGGNTCSLTCRTFFRVCLKHFQADISSEQPCTFGSETTPVIGYNSFDFPESLESFTNPIRLPFDFDWPGTFSLIIEAWHDSTDSGPSQDSPRVLISQLKKQSSVEVGQEWKHFEYEAEPGSVLSYSYRVICDPYYYGSECSEMCKPRDDKFGHYTCTENGTKSCLDGWGGPYCDQAICLPGCHEEHGYCDRPNECKCRLGWQGRYCDQCIPYPGCQHGSCQDQPWQCQCEEGWGGLFCNQDLNYCTHHKPCRNGATCTNTGQGSYTCECAPGFSGTNCEMEVDDCLHQPCRNGGTCKDRGAVYECECPQGFHGRHCESSAKSCDEQPCKNGAQCSSFYDSYRCECPAGYTGVNCERDVDECSSNPCENGGRCIDERNGFRCVCPSGWSGIRCTENTNDCSMAPCLNGGTCEDRINDFECRCQPGFVGELCQTNIDDCLNWPCANGGTCHDLVNDFECDCAPGFEGKDCRDNVNECAVQPCHNGGTCTDQVNDYECECPKGYYGKSCEFPDGFIPPLRSQPPVDGHSPQPVGSTQNPVIVVDGNTAKSSDEEESVVTMNQLLLIICLGVGIPILIIIVIIVFLLFNRRRNNATDSSAVNKENAQNEIINNKNKCLAVDNINKPTNNPNAQPNVVLKIQNEDSRTLPPKKNNTDKSYNKNKHYNKDLISNSTSRGVHSSSSCSYNNRDILDDSDFKKPVKSSHMPHHHPHGGGIQTIDSLKKSLDMESSSTSTDSVIDISEYAGDVRIVKNINTDANSILLLDQHRHQVGMLATEV